MIEERIEFGLGELGDDDRNLDLLFSGVRGVAPFI